MNICRPTGIVILLLAVGFSVEARSSATDSTLGAECTATPDPNAPRSQIPDQCKWNLNHLYATPEAWEEEFRSLSEKIPGIGPACKGKLASSSETMLFCLDTSNELLRRLYQLDTYAGRAFDQDQSVDATKVRNGRVQMLMPSLADEVSFMEPEILAMDRSVLDGWLSTNPKLAVYRYYFDDLFRMRPHTLGTDEERLLALFGNVGDSAYYAHEALLNEDLTFPAITNERGEQEPLTVTGFTRYRGSSNPLVRKQATDVFFSGLSEYENTFASDLDAIVKAHIFMKEARGYESCLQAALTPDDIDPAVYHTLIDTINANLRRTLHKYIELRRKVLGIEGALTFDNLYNPLLSETVERNWTYDEGRQLVRKALEPLGPDYVSTLETGMDPVNGWVDIYPSAKKDSGAYMSGSAYTVHPYVLLNHNNDLESVFTIAHEFGHAMHTFYSNRAQPYVYSDYAIFNAEIASTTNEELLLSYLLATTPKKDVDARLMLLNQRLENIRLTIFRQTLFAEFELAIHEHAEKGNPLTADFIDETYAGLIRKYYGPNYAMGGHDASEWAFIPHFYYNFYVFTYATGLTSGLSLAHQILQPKTGARAAERYKKEMLSAGSSAPPLTILRNAGVDLANPQPILDMLDLFEETVDEFSTTWDRRR